jgi:hypothetical protein
VSKLQKEQNKQEQPPGCFASLSITDLVINKYRGGKIHENKTNNTNHNYRGGAAAGYVERCEGAELRAGYGLDKTDRPDVGILESKVFE